MRTSAPRLRPDCRVALDWRIASLMMVWLTFAPPSLVAAPTNPSPDGLWVDVSATDLPITGPILLSVPEGSFRLCRLDTDVLLQVLGNAPLESALPVRDSGVDMSLPMPSGGYARFRVVESPVLAPSLQSQHPELRTYVAQGIDDPSATVRLDWTPLGFHAMVLSVEGTIVIDPYRRDDVLHYRSFYKHDARRDPDGFRCYVSDAERMLDGQIPSIQIPSGSVLRTYRLAITATGEYTQYFGGVTQAQAAITTTVNRIDGIYERELTIRLSIVGFNVYPNPATDPFASPIVVGGALLTQNQILLNAKFGMANYDIGHLVNAGGGGGMAAFGVCSDMQKGRGATSIPDPVGDVFDVDYVAHEIGHQFHGDHTFNGTTGNCAGNRVIWSAYEPGSGSTIMAYAGICGAEDLQQHSDPYFHTHSFDQIVYFRESGGTCGQATATGNTPPTVDAGPDVTIPLGTPFTLTAMGGDADLDALTYCWEEFDLGAPTPPPSTVTGPLFRSFEPISSSSRTFPRLQDILAGTSTPWERLPIVNRTMRFRCTVRDNRAGGGGVSSDEVLITAGGAPFHVTFPNGGETLTGGCPLALTWNVGGGSVAPTVDILYSADGGASFTPLTVNTANDGGEIVALPCGSTAQGRIEVRAVGNVFFDVSDADFGVAPGVAPAVSANATGGPVDASCQRTVTYSGSIVDDCGVDAGSVSVTVSLPSANATLGVPSTSKVQSDGRTVTVSGSVVVSSLLGSPAIVRLRIDASDHCGNPVSHTVDASVVDTTPPEIDVVLDRDALWPPNHRMSAIVATVTATDLCASNPTVVLASITSDEPDDDKGDGHFPDDIQEASYGSLDTQFLLRAERQGTGSGRTYTIVYTASDMSGNIGRDTVCVRVPHDLAGNGIEPARPLGAQGEDRTQTAAGKPVGPETSSVTQVTPVVVDIYSALGRKVGSVMLDVIPASGAALRWDGTDEMGKRLPSGVYFYRVRGREGTRTHKLVLVH